MQLSIRDDYHHTLSLQLNQKQTSRWFAARQLLRPSVVHFDTGHIFSLQALPKSQPTLTIPTVWATVDGHKEFTTLIDTGCNTSIIHSDLLHTLRDEDGNHFKIVEMKEPQSLLSASGGIVKVNRSASLTFHVDGVPIYHAFYLMDTMPMPQKILLGMDFVIEHGLCIDAPNDTMHHDTKEQGSVGQSATSGDGKHHTPSISITLCLAGFSKQLEHHTHFWLHLPRQRTARRLHSLAWCVRVTACWRSGMANQRFGQTYHRQQQHTIGLG